MVSAIYFCATRLLVDFVHALAPGMLSRPWKVYVPDYFEIHIHQALKQKAVVRHKTARRLDGVARMLVAFPSWTTKKRQASYPAIPCTPKLSLCEA
jgi:hypothetical protein